MSDAITERVTQALELRRASMKAEKQWAETFDLPSVSVWESNIFHAGYLAGRRAALSEQEGTRQNRSEGEKV